MESPGWLVCARGFRRVDSGELVQCARGVSVDLEVCRGCHLLVDVEFDRIENWCEFGPPPSHPAVTREDVSPASESLWSTR